MIASVSKSSKIVVEKSTVPVKTAEAISKVRVFYAAPCGWPCPDSSATEPKTACISYRPTVEFMTVLVSVPHDDRGHCGS